VELFVFNVSHLSVYLKIVQWQCGRHAFHSSRAYPCQ